MAGVLSNPETRITHIHLREITSPAMRAGVNHPHPPLSMGGPIVPTWPAANVSSFAFRGLPWKRV